MKITMVEQITELTDNDKVLLISGDDIKQIDRKVIFDTARIATLEKRTEELKKYGADVKKGFADVISEKGVPTADTDSFETMQENVRKISDNTTDVYGRFVISDYWTHPIGVMCGIYGLLPVSKEAS